MQEIISSILQAEKKAEEIIENALSEAKSKKLAGDATAEQIKNSAVENFKANRVSVLSKAEQDAELAYNDAVRKGREESMGKVEQARANLFKAADFIVEKVVK